jgi:hypothetical protein
LVRIATAAGILVGITCVASVTIVVGYPMEALTSAAKKEIPAENAPAETKAE